MLPEQISLGYNKSRLQRTTLGWVVSGKINLKFCQNRIHCNFSKPTELHDQLARFWEVEETCTQRLLSQEEAACEAHFSKTVRRDDEGRFIVSIPLKHPVELLGESRIQAERRFRGLEKRLSQDQKLHDSYVKFLSEYESLGHMTKVDVADNHDNSVTYYLPHHGVLRENSETTKLRVVFDASAVTTSGWSLNDIQMVGPTIQQDLFSIVLRFRKHVFVFSADVEKMYRQVLIEPSQRCLQRILWRKNPNEQVEVYTLNTVTYGTAAASYLAIRCLHELAHTCTNERVANILLSDFYVDDLLSGSDTKEEAVELCKQISERLQDGCFNLRKWRSNDPSILQFVENETDAMVLDLSTQNNSKTLGLRWSCADDHLMYSIQIDSNKVVTKRSILSSASQIFDPLGLLSPCVIIPKIILQKLWLEKLDWDDPVPHHIHQSWSRFITNLPILNDLRIERRVRCTNAKVTEMHGFSDASENAYGCAIYVRSINQNGDIFVNLFCAKSKVAPIKTLTMPRLELCGALLLSRLARGVLQAADFNFTNCTFWTDSTIVLGWLKTSPHLLKSFVNNRVAEIQTVTQSHTWRHVPTQDNPADLISRGVQPNSIQNLDLWWHGPNWLHNSYKDWPSLDVKVDVLPEIKGITRSFKVTELSNFFPFERFSKFNRMVRASAYVLRFAHNLKDKDGVRRSGNLSVSELGNALKFLIQLLQKESFPKEYASLSKGHSLKTDSKILSLAPFMDSEGVIRVGGRLQNSNFAYDKKHPMLLSPTHKFTELLFREEHIRLFHAGPQLLLANTRERFWTIAGRNISKKIVRSCTTCFRHKPISINPIMGNLPKARLEPVSAFSISGVDYAGPLKIKDRKGRGNKVTKCWICLFVCFSVKAVHIEVVSDLTTESFIAALRRFVSRRGKPSHIYSDNGTTFVGANAELAELGKFLISKGGELSSLIANEGISWHFMPPYSPHFGGIWESGIKSMKHHLKRVAGNTCFLYDELNTLLTQIEAIMNSRPLFSISSDPEDLAPITPAHFLIGKSLTSVPDPDLTDLPENRLSRFQRIQFFLQHIWQRWSKEYVSELQQRQKWKTSTGELQVDDLVLIKEDNVPPFKWRLGRIVSLHPGSDGVNRVASIRTIGGVIKRAFAKICPLPSSDI